MDVLNTQWNDVEPNDKHESESWNTHIRASDYSWLDRLRYIIEEYKMMANNSEIATMYPWYNSSVPSGGNNHTQLVITDANNKAEEGCVFFTFICYVVIFGTMCVFGLIGNTLSFFVLQWEKQNHVATFLLQAMALVDNLFLITTGFSQIFSAIALYIKLDHTPLWVIMKVGVWPMVYITQLATVWMTVLIAFNRYIAICRPFQAHKLCTMTRTRSQIIIMFVLIIIYNLPRFFENRIVYNHYPGTNETYPAGEENINIKLNPYYNYIYEVIMYCLFYFLGPMIVLVVFNTCLIRELWNARKRLLARQLPANMMGGEEAENSLTLVMIVIILIFLCCQLPAFLNQLIYIINVNAYACGNAYFYFYHFSNIIASANSCVNFIVYCIFRKQFRERLKAFCRRDHLMKRTDMYNYDNGKTASVYSKNSNAVNL